ncbi:hypothetical protein STAS_05881 [Striga asiatica]|uniref:Uncharacterized protein n=1 Tax=Striga asiatica TaxID=4170 RepID=A0A5A7PBR5_STRAF|nr:hypothetical protein STAS_05881 [Striga asiatica]
MESEKNFKENGPPHSPSAPRLSSPDSTNEPYSPGSTTRPNNGNLNIPKPEPEENLISFSPVVGDNKGASVENKEPPQSRDNHHETSPKSDHGPAQSSYDASDGPTTQKPEKEENTEPKIVARPTPEDDFIPFVPSPHHRRAISMDHLVAKVPANYGNSPTSTSASARSKLSSNSSLSRGQIDTAAPFESVKAAVSKFGGIVDWKAHRVQTVERRKFIEQELEKAQEEMPTYKQQCEAAEDAKTQVLKELDSTKRLIEELKLNLERAQKEEQQAKQDAELANLRLDEMEQGIADEASFAAKAQLEVARARHTAAVSELKTVYDELDQLRKDYSLLISEKEVAAKKAEEAVSISKEVEKSVEDLTIELITLKQSLESAHSEHLEAEEHRLGAIMAKEQDAASWQEELRKAEAEIERLNASLLSTRDLKTKLDEATSLLHGLKAELAAYMETETANVSEQKTRGDIQAEVVAAKEELEEVRLKIERTNEGVNVLREESKSLKLELEREKMELLGVQQREGMASIAAASLEAELNTTVSEIAIIRAKEEEESEKMADLTKKLEEATREAEDARALVQKAREEAERVREEAERAKAGKLAKESQLKAAQKEIEAAKASERLALAAISALEESESAAAAKKADDDDDDTSGVTLSLDEYYKLSKRAHEAEVEANARVAAAVSQVEAAKESELKSLSKLEEVSREMSAKKDELEIAQLKAEQATEGKLAVEQELRKWRAEHEQRRKADQSGPRPVNTSKSPLTSPKKSFSGVAESSTLHQRSSPRAQVSKEEEKEALADGKGGKKKKKSFFPRIFMFLARKKAHGNKKD